MGLGVFREVWHGICVPGGGERQFKVPGSKFQVTDDRQPAFGGPPPYRLQRAVPLLWTLNFELGTAFEQAGESRGVGTGCRMGAFRLRSPRRPGIGDCRMQIVTAGKPGESESAEMPMAGNSSEKGACPLFAPVMGVPFSPFFPFSPIPQSGLNLMPLLCVTEYPPAYSWGRSGWAPHWNSRDASSGIRPRGCHGRAPAGLI